jgi:hypothetical protein
MYVYVFSHFVWRACIFRPPQTVFLTPVFLTPGYDLYRLAEDPPMGIQQIEVVSNKDTRLCAFSANIALSTKAFLSRL